MKNLARLLLLLALGLAPPIWAQGGATIPAQANITASDSGSCATAGACLTVNLPQNSASAVVQITGTFSATLQFEGSTKQGGTFVAVNAFPLNSTTPVTSTTSTGAWRVTASGLAQVRVRCSAFTSGTAAVDITQSQGSSGSGGGGGGGGGGAVDSVSGDGVLITNVASTGSVSLTLGTAPANQIFGNCTASPAVPAYCAIVAAMVPTLNQNTTGTAANLSGTPALPNGTTATTQAAADNTTKIATDAFVLANAGGFTAGGDLSGSSTVQQVIGFLGVPFASVTGFLFDNGGAGVIRALVSTDIPNNTANTSGTSSNVTGVVATPNGGSGVASPTAHGFAVSEGTSPFNFICTGGLTGQVFQANNGADPSCLSPGVAGRSVSGATDTIQADSSTTILDRLNTIDWTDNAAVAVTQPVHTTTGLGSNFAYVGTTIGGGSSTAATITPGGGDTINGQSTLVLGPNVSCSISNPANAAAWLARCANWIKAGSGITATYNADGSTTLASTGGGGSTSLGGRALTGGTSTDAVVSGDSGTVINHDVAATSAVAESLPTATTLSNSTFFYTYWNHSAYTDTVTPTTWTIQKNESAAGSALTIRPAEECIVKVDTNSSTNWLASCIVLAPDQTIYVQNATSTGTTQGSLACLTTITGHSYATICPTSATDGAVGIVLGHAGTTGQAVIQTAGVVNCPFPSGTTAGDFVQISSATAGDCVDAGATRPAGGEVLGLVQSTNAGAGAYGIVLNIQGPSASGTQTIANGTATLGTSAIASTACATVVTVTATGVASTDSIAWNPNASIKAVTGYVASTSGGLSIAAYPTSGNVNFDVCNWSSGSITPGAVTLNWRVTR